MKRTSRVMRHFAACCLLMGAASSLSIAQPQALNVDLDVNFPGETGAGAPAPTYAAAASQTGMWNSLLFGEGPFALRNTAGAATTVTLTRSLNAPVLTFDNGAAGDFARLVNDGDRVDGTITYTFNGLPAGTYTVYTYAAAPFFGTIATRITINGSAQLVAGASGDFVFAQGSTHARHTVSVAAGAPLVIQAARASLQGIVNGFQLVPIIPAEVSIASPASCRLLSGVVEIRGTASSPSLTGWSLQYTGGDASGWVTIASGSTSVVNGVLGTWDTAGLRPCGYTLRLRTSDQGGGQETMRSFVVAAAGDANLDGVVSFEDVSFVLNNFNEAGPAQPEPDTDPGVLVP